jgi:hypothetical protein
VNNEALIPHLGVKHTFLRVSAFTRFFQIDGAHLSLMFVANNVEAFIG